MECLPNIDVLVALDTHRLAELLRDGRLSSGSASQPRWLNGPLGTTDRLVAIFAQSSSALGSEPDLLVLRAGSRTRLTWSITGLDANTSYTPAFCRGLFVRESSRRPALSNLTVAGSVQETAEYLPTGSNASPEEDPTTTPYTVQRCSGPVLAPDEALLALLELSVIDNMTGESIGYFGWAQRILVRGAPPS